MADEVERTYRAITYTVAAVIVVFIVALAWSDIAAKKMYYEAVKAVATQPSDIEQYGKRNGNK